MRLFRYETLLCLDWLNGCPGDPSKITNHIEIPSGFHQQDQRFEVERLDVMMSFDVTVYVNFTRLGQKLGTETPSPRRLYRNEDSELSVADNLELLKFSLDAVFTFYGEVYRHIYGTPVGSSVSGVIAEAVPRDLEGKVMEHLQPHFWARFVDDKFVVIKREDKSRFLDVLNGFFWDMQRAYGGGGGGLLFTVLGVLVTG